MTYVGIRDLKAHLSEYVKNVRRGEDVIITDHGKPVARLVGNVVSKDGRSSLASLAAEGLVVLPARNKKHFKGPVVGSNIKGKSLSDIIVEDRR